MWRAEVNATNKRESTLLFIEAIEPQRCHCSAEWYLQSLALDQLATDATSSGGLESRVSVFPCHRRPCGLQKDVCEAAP